jgi:hypothetical protein
MILCSVAALSFFLSEQDLVNRDYFSFWSAGQALSHNQSPFGAIVTVLDHGEPTRHVICPEWTARPQGSSPLREVRTNVVDYPCILYPPFALFLTAPLGFMSVRAGAVFWSLEIIGLVVTSIRILWTMHGEPEGRLHLLGYLFAPVMACLLAGQTSAILLFGLTLFLNLHCSRPLLAGVALSLCLIKPHLFAPFMLCILLWSISRRSWRVLSGIALGFCAMSLVAVAMRSSIWSDYLAMLRLGQIQKLFIPNLSTIFRIAIDPASYRLQFVPEFAACMWAVWYFTRNRATWNWNTSGSLVLLVSVVAVPYSWFTDEAILLPAILASIFALARQGCSLIAYGVIAAAALFEVLSGIQMPSGLYIWTPLAWLCWYLWASRQIGEPGRLGAFSQGNC